jgi:hypothetical protein
MLVWKKECPRKLKYLLTDQRVANGPSPPKRGQELSRK